MSKADKISISFPADELKAIDSRVRELGLPEHGGRSKYFQLLREYDARLQLQLYPHRADRTWHFYPEDNLYTTFAAEEAARITKLLAKEQTRKDSAVPTPDRGK